MRSGLLILIGIFLLALLIGGTMFYFLSNNSSDNDNIRGVGGDSSESSVSENSGSNTYLYKGYSRSNSPAPALSEALNSNS